MKVMDNLEEMRVHLPEAACARMVAVIEAMRDYVEGSLEQASFTELFGAPAYLIEQVEELASVQSAEEREGRRLSLAEGASGWFDIAEWVDSGEFARFVTIDGPDGGPQFLVPKRIADETSAVEDSIKLTTDRYS